MIKRIFAVRTYTEHPSQTIPFIDEVLAVDGLGLPELAPEDVNELVDLGPSVDGGPPGLSFVLGGLPIDPRSRS